MLEKIIFRKEKSRNPCISTVSGLEWQGQKDLNPRHAVLEACILSLFIAIYRLSGDISGDIYCFLQEKYVVRTTNSAVLILCIFTYYSFNIHRENK